MASAIAPLASLSSVVSQGFHSLNKSGLSSSIFDNASFPVLVPPFTSRSIQSLENKPRTRPCSKICASSVFIALSAATPDTPTVADTKSAFLSKYRKPIPSIYNNVIQELIVQQHLIRYNRLYSYDAIFALGFVTVYDQLMDGYPNDADREKIFAAYIEALSEDPEAYRSDSALVEEWASSQTSQSLLDFSSRADPIDLLLKDIAERSKEGKFYYSRLFSIGLFRILELANASDPSILEKLCASLGLNKIAVDRDLGVYRALLNKLTQAKDLLKDFLEREQRKLADREKEKSLSPTEQSN